MKFVCDQCKAKYQISDEKVVGKTVKMKCRKCGHMIEVRAAVTETSVATSMPKESADDRAPASPGTPSPSGASPYSGSSGGGASPPRPAVGGHAGGHASAGGGGGPPRPGALKTSPLATSLGAQRPAPPRAGAGGGGSGGSNASAHANATGALAGAFNRTVQRDDEPTVGAGGLGGSGGYELREISAADEWYAAINGVPVGPIRVAELRRKAALGAVTEDSLVWQEGLEEWRPVRAFPELAEMVREAAAVGRPSLLPPAAWEGNAGSTGRPGSVRPGPPQRAHIPAPPRVPTAGPLPAVAAVAKSNVIPISSRLATAEKLEEISVAVPTSELAAPPPVAVAAPFGMSGPAMASGIGTPAPTSAFAAAAPAPQGASQQGERKPVPWIPIGMLVIAAAFGVTLAFVVGLKPQQVAPAPAPSVIIIEKAAAPTAPVATAEAPVAAAPSASAAPPPSKGTGGGVAGNTGTPKPAPPSGKIDLGGLLGGGPAGPSAGGPGGGPSGGGGGPLTSGQIEQVVASRRIGVRRACWEKAENSASSVKVTVKMTIGGNGLVQNATASGNDPAIAGCIEKNVRTWTFAATGGTTNAEIPFSFVRQ